jgi:hypothetical protein
MSIPVGTSIDDGLYSPETDTIYYPDGSKTGSVTSSHYSAESGSLAVQEKESSDSKYGASSRKVGASISTSYDPEGIIATILGGAGL